MHVTDVHRSQDHRGACPVPLEWSFDLPRIRPSNRRGTRGLDLRWLKEMPPLTKANSCAAFKKVVPTKGIEKKAHPPVLPTPLRTRPPAFPMLLRTRDVETDRMWLTATQQRSKHGGSS